MCFYATYWDNFYICQCDLLTEIIKLNYQVFYKQLTSNGLKRLPTKMASRWDIKTLANVSPKEEPITMSIHCLWNYPSNVKIDAIFKTMQFLKQPSDTNFESILLYMYKRGLIEILLYRSYRSYFNYVNFHQEFETWKWLLKYNNYQKKKKKKTRIILSRSFWTIYLIKKRLLHGS